MEATEGIRREPAWCFQLELSSTQPQCGRSLGFSLKLSRECRKERKVALPVIWPGPCGSGVLS